jgi:hypothetical protein
MAKGAKIVGREGWRRGEKSILINKSKLME